MAQYAAPVPIDRYGNSMEGYPASASAMGRYAPENSSASSVITLSDNTTVVEIAASGANGAVMRWVAAGDTTASVISVAGGTANFDHVIPATSVRRFVVPIELRTVQASVAGMNIQMGLYRRVAIKSIGISSVLTSEF